MTNKPFGAEWITEYFAMVDRRNPEELVSWYNDDGSFMFANSPVAHGKDAIIKALKQFYKMIESMHHEKTGVWVDGETGVWEAKVHFIPKATGRELVLPAASILRLRGGKVQDFRMYMDATPITSPSQ